MMATPSPSSASPYTQMFGHHERAARLLVESPSPTKRISSRRHIRSQRSHTLTVIPEDHVVRGSRSSGTRSGSSAFSVEASLRPAIKKEAPPPAPALSEIDPNSQKHRPHAAVKSSPSPSLKKRKAEQILQQHGSPPGIRVTASGRIVPSEQSPLCSPRYGYSAILKNGGLIKFAPGYPPPQKTFPNFAKSLPNGFIAQDPEGKLCQMVDGHFLQIPEVNGIPQLFIAAPNVIDNVAWSGFQPAADDESSLGQPKPRHTSQSTSTKSTPGPTIAAQVAALEKQYKKLEMERRSLDKAEVLKRDELTGKAYSQLIQKRRDLVTRQDELRRSIKTLQETPCNPEPRPDSRSNWPLPGHAMPPPYANPHQFPTFAELSGVSTPRHQPPPFMMPQDQGFSMPSHYFPVGYPGAAHITLPPYLVPTHGAPVGPFPPGFMATPMQSSLAQHPSEDENGRRHAVDSNVRYPKFGLNPLSPVYEPTGRDTSSPSKSDSGAPKKDTTSTESSTQTYSSDQRRTEGESEQSEVHSSGSSYATADFFPNNPREHSLKQDAYPPPDPSTRSKTSSDATMHRSDSDEAIAQPEMERHNVNWNPTIPDQAFQGKLPDRPASLDDSPYFTTEQSKDGRSSPEIPVDEFTKGYKAGLDRATIASDSGPVFLAGYCKGLLQSAAISSIEEKASSSEKPVVRFPSVGDGVARHDCAPLKSHPSQASSFTSGAFNDLREAIMAPGNENAILSPDPEGPCVDSMTDKHLGAWAKRGIAHTSDEVLRALPIEGAARIVNSSVNEDMDNSGQKSRDHHPMLDDGHPSVEGTSSVYATEHRAFSAQTQPADGEHSSYMQRVYPSLRVMSSPAMDWKSSTSMGHMAGMATGYFAQFDGTTSKPSSKCAEDSGPHAGLVGKFREATLPDDDSPASPSQATSTPSPKKSISPAKARFAAIAGKAGIKVRLDRTGSKEANDLEPMSPQESRRWRDIWKKRNNAID